MNITTPKIAVKIKKTISNLNPSMFISLIGFFDKDVVAIRTITDKPRLIIKILLPRAEPKDTPYRAILAA